MKLGTIGCFTGSAAALLFGGCAADQYAATDAYRGSYVQTTTDTQPVFVERRSVVVDNQPRIVPVYRTGDAYFYSYGGRRYTMADYPAVRSTAVVETPVVSRARYSRYQRVVDRPVVSTDYTGDENTAFRRTTVTTPAVTTYETAPSYVTPSDGKSVVTEPEVPTNGY